MRSTTFFGIVLFLLMLFKVQAGQGCPSGSSYLAHTGRCYRVYNILNTYDNALETCQADGGTLAMPRDSTTNNFLIALKNGANTNNRFYFGLDRKDGSWNYVDGGELRYTDWAYGEPNNNGNEQCAEYFPGTHDIDNRIRNKWNDVNCLNHVGFICEFVPLGSVTLTKTPDPVREDDNVQLTCSVTSGTPPFTYTFHRGSTQLYTGAADTTTVAGIRRNQASGYTCTVQGGPGYAKASSQESVNVQYLDAPILISGHSDTTLNGQTVTIVEGKRLSVKCSAEANPTASIQWSGSNVGSGAVLNKNSVTQADDGTYTCTATSSNIVGQPKFTSVQLQVNVASPPDGHPECSATTSRNNVFLTCELQGGNPAVDLVWTYGSGLQSGTSRKSVNQVIAPVTTGGTTYTCTATSVALETPRTCTLATPTVSVSPQPTSTVHLGTASHSLTCTVDSPGIPAASALTWTGPAVEAGRTTGGDLATPSLTISGVLKSDAGNYTCTATNSIGKDTDSLSLVVQSQPDRPTNFTYTKKTAAGLVTLTWTAGFNGGPETNHTVQYRMEGTTDWVNGPSVVEASSWNRPEFTRNVTFSEKGMYEIHIRAQNREGSVESNVIQVLVEGSQILYGTLVITSVKYTEGVCEGDLTYRMVKLLDYIFDSYKGYEGTEVTGCRSGSVLADFEATVAQSEAAAAQDTFRERAPDGHLWELEVEQKNSRIGDVKPGNDIDPAGRSGNLSTVIIIAVSVSAVVLIAGIVVVILLVRRHTSRDEPPTNLHNSVELDHVAGDADDGYQSLRVPHSQKSDHTYQGLKTHKGNEIPPEPTYEDVKMSSEFPRSQLNIKEEVGKGEFGSVHRAEARNILGELGMTVVAVKTMKAVTSPAALSAFRKELAILKSLGTHPNVVSFLGSCTDTEPFYLLLEYVSGGSLQSTLRTSRTQQTYGNLHGGSKSLSSRDLTRFAWDVAKGMSFLSAKKILHRDLATRNVLVSADRTCKVSDFGLSREGEEYERTTKTRLPVRWMAPESLFHRKYTTKTDVWAFGVLLWEIVTLGATPYLGMSKREVMDGVQQGYRMGKPPHCEDKIYSLMQSCWNEQPAERPSFSQLERDLDSLSGDEHDNINLAHFDENAFLSRQTSKEEKF